MTKNVRTHPVLFLRLLLLQTLLLVIPSYTTTQSATTKGPQLGKLTSLLLFAISALFQAKFTLNSSVHIRPITTFNGLAIREPTQTLRSYPLQPSLELWPTIEIEPQNMPRITFLLLRLLDGRHSEATGRSESDNREAAAIWNRFPISFYSPIGSYQQIKSFHSPSTN